jgi:hypothetical protein
MKMRTFLALSMLFTVETAATASDKPVNPPQAYDYPLKVSADGKHLTDQTNTPFLVVADVAWQLLRKLDYTEAVQYLDIRKGQSFNTVLIQVLPSLPTQRNFQKATPFQGENDITNPNKVYFDYLEKVVSAAKERNMAVGLVVSRQSWNIVFETQGEEVSRNFGEYIGNRFSGLDNIFWIVSEDESQKTFLSRTLTEGLRKSSAHKLVASLSTCTPPDSMTSYDTDLKVFVPDSTVTDSEYAALASWQKNIGKSMKSPFLIANSEFPIKDQSALIRKQAYESLLNSAAGFCHMSTIKNFNPTWKSNITKDGGEYMKYLVKILKGLPWDYLEPAASLKMVQDTTQTSEISVSALTNHRMVMMYIPTYRSFAIDLSQLTGEEFSAVWYSPRTGRRWSGGALKRNGFAAIQPPDPQPEWDWILLVGSKN